MQNLPEPADFNGLREWLRCERGLGVPHWDTGAAAASAASQSTSHQAERRAAPAPPRLAPSRPAPTPSAAAPRPAAVTPLASAPTLLTVSDNRGLPPLCEEELSKEAARAALDELDRRFVQGCTSCGLHSGRNKTVFGVGNPRPDIVFVGEGPGADEDREGLPFVGRAGQLLTRMIAAMTLTRDQVYICNVVKCRPPENRTPADDEMRACSPYLLRQLAILRPKVIVALGRPAAQTLLATSTPIGKLRGQFYEFPPLPLSHLPLPKTPLMPTFHPAYLLRQPDEKGKSWDDLKAVMTLLGLAVPARA